MRGVTALRGIGFAAACFCLAAGCATPREPRIVTLPQTAVRPADLVEGIGSYERAVATIAVIFERDLGFAPFPAALHFYPGRRAFEAALLEAGYDPGLARSTAGTMGAVGGHRRVLLNESTLDPLPWPARVGLLAHELTHSLQYEWGGGVRGASDQWLREGFAEWVAARVLERLRAGSLGDERARKFRELQALDTSRLPRLHEMATFPEWVEVNRRSGIAAYAYAFLAADALIERHGMRAVVNYFQLFALSGDRVVNFRAAFGEDLPAFEAALATRLRRP